MYAFADSAIRVKNFRPAARPHRHSYRRTGSEVQRAGKRHSSRKLRRDTRASIRARHVQQERFHGEKIFSNAQMSPRLIRRYCIIDKELNSLLENVITRLGLSARAYDRILKMSRALADIESKEQIEAAHVSEAIQYRTLDRNFWA